MKDKQRKLLLKKRGALNKSYIRSRSLSVSRKVAAFARKGSVVASYSPYRNELNPNLFLDLSRIYFPKVDKKANGSMGFYRGVLVKSFKGIKEPLFGKRKIFKKLIDVIIVPGVGFDEKGYRIGYGLGFYDRFLSNLKALKIGVVFDCCLVKEVDSSKYDVPVDVVITEKRKIFCRLRR